ncbi:MerR family transcriptional regulator [Furfurilactobacillus curtus]|uniref:MerR family transcriptional regulator n=1 Tax=Furfurilactobacillus curtus TaxID=1746200 RepID=A0ABQ5JQ51_9LACO
METYSIHQVAEQLQLSISTIRYYDQQGLLPFVTKNKAGHREFTVADLGFMRTITCLKQTGMVLRDIRQYILLCMAGASSIPARRQLLAAHRQAVMDKQAQLTAGLVEIDQKLVRYEAPDAKQLINQQVTFAISEKEQHGLANPFATDALTK